jgi:hypothetical protein
MAGDLIDNSSLKIIEINHSVKSIFDFERKVFIKFVQGISNRKEVVEKIF